MALRSTEWDLWWAEGTGLVTGAFLALALCEWHSTPTRAALLVASAGGLRLAFFIVWRVLHGEGKSSTTKTVSLPAASRANFVKPSASSQRLVPLRETSTHEPLELSKIEAERSPGREGTVGRSADKAREESEPNLPDVGEVAPVGEEISKLKAEQPPSVSPERLVEVWARCLNEGEGYFDAPTLCKSLAASGLFGEVLGEAEGSPGRNLFAVDLSRGSDHFFLLPLPGVTARSVADWFFSPSTEGSRLARIQRLVTPAIAHHGAQGWTLVTKGVVE